MPQDIAPRGRDRPDEITAAMIEAGVMTCLLYDVENVGDLHAFVADLYRTMAAAGSLSGQKPNSTPRRAQALGTEDQE